VVKFTYDLRDAEGELLAAWHKDMSHGLHTHPVIDAQKGSEHLPFSGTETELTHEILKTITRHLQV